MPQRGLGLVQSGGRWERREAVPRWVLGLEQSGGLRERREAVPRRVLVLSKAEAGANAVRRCRGGGLVLADGTAGGSAVSQCRAGVLVVTWTNGIKARRVCGKALSKLGAEEKAVRRSAARAWIKRGPRGRLRSNPVARCGVAMSATNGRVT